MKVVLRPSAVDSSKVRGWLTPHTEYLVLAVEASATGENSYRIESEDNRTPALFEAKLFTLVNNRLPTLWIAVQQQDLLLQLMPARWSEDGFWERFFDGDPEACRVYEDAIVKMQDESESWESEQES